MATKRHSPASRAHGGIRLRRASDGSFQVDERSLHEAAGVKEQAAEAQLLSKAIRERKEKAR
jgi:hypothetical protein